MVDIVIPPATSTREFDRTRFREGLLSIDDLMVKLHCSRAQIYKLMAHFGLPAHRIACRWRFVDPEVNAWLASQPFINKPGQAS